MSATEDQEALRAGDVVAGHFRLLGDNGEVPGTLRWSPARGALLELTDAPTGWPLFDDGPFVVHGETRSGLLLTLLDPLVRTVSLGDRVSRISAHTLGVGGHTDPTARWPKAVLGTPVLSEWRDDSGFKVSRPALRTKPTKLRLEWEPPTTDEVPVAGAVLRFAGRMSSSGGGKPHWSLHTWQVVEVEPRAALTIGQHRQRYGAPLLALTTFVGDRPDAISRESYRDPSVRAGIDIWRVGSTPEHRPWTPLRCLFGAEELLDYPRAIQKWWRLHKRVRPALDVFGDHLSHGRNYSPARLITLYTALEAYGRARHKTTDFRALRSYAGLPSSLTGCTNLDSSVGVVG